MAYKIRKIDIKTCVCCRAIIVRPIYVSSKRFKYRRFCSPICGYKYRLGRATRKPFDYTMPETPLYDRIDNTQYDKQISEVTGLSKRYLDGEINLDTLRMMEVISINKLFLTSNQNSDGNY